MVETSTIKRNSFLDNYLLNMPTLIQSLHGRDIGFLRIVARFWGIELISSDSEMVIKELAKTLNDKSILAEMIASLTIDSRSALEMLVRAEGKVPWVTFTRRFGEIRPAGPAKRDREQIFLHQGSVSEMLFYRAFLARAFFDFPAGVQEYAYIPDDFLQIINQIGFPPASFAAGKPDFEKTTIKLDTKASDKSAGPLGRIASPKESEFIIPVSDRILDDATTLLAALRLGQALPHTGIPLEVLTEYLLAAKLVSPSSLDEIPQPFVLQIESVRLFLEASRRDALEILVKAWRESEIFNELLQVPGLIFEGSVSNTPQVARKFILSQLEKLPKNKWWSLPAFIQGIKEKNPDFQRPAGDYDSWFIRRESDGSYLRGFPYWDGVDGALIRYLITGPLYWLGQVELATRTGSEVVSAFRVAHCKSSNLNEEDRKLYVSAQGKISVPRLLPRSARYQIARFCEWENEKADEYVYQVTTTSLKLAREQGLNISQLLTLLAKNSASEIPPAFVKAVKRWDLNGTEAWLEVQTILKVGRPEVLDELRKSKAGRFLGEPLGPVTVVVKMGAHAKVLAALAELGLLGEVVQ